jgi:hypothetical protein
MLPNEALSATVLSGTFLSPRTDLRNPNLTNALVAYHIGGVAVNDPSQGLLYQTWQGTYDGTYVNVQGLTNLNTYAAVGPLANIQWFDFAFDNAMRPYVVYVDVALNSWLYYYNTSTSSFATISLNCDPWPFCFMDDTRATQSSACDVIAAYTRAGDLYFLAQRDAFGIEYNLGAIPAGKPLVQTGMNNVNRVQFEFAALSPLTSPIYGKFVPASVFLANQLSNVDGIHPKIYVPPENRTIQSVKKVQ